LHFSLFKSRKISLFIRWFRISF